MSLQTVTFKNQLIELQKQYSEFLSAHRRLHDFILSDQLLDDDKTFHQLLTDYGTKIITSPEISRAILESNFARQLAQQQQTPEIQPQAKAEEISPTTKAEKKEISPTILVIIAVIVVALMSLFVFWGFSDVQKQMNILQLTLINATSSVTKATIERQIDVLRGSQDSLLDAAKTIAVALIIAIPIFVAVPKIVDAIRERLAGKPETPEEPKTLLDLIAEKLEEIRRRYKAEYFFVKIQFSTQIRAPEYGYLPKEVLMRKEQRLKILRADLPPMLEWITIRVNEAVMEQINLLNSYIVSASQAAAAGRLS
jgi:hypothetical protein